MIDQRKLRRLARKLLIDRHRHVWLLTVAVAVLLVGAERAGLAIPIPFLLLLISVAISGALGGIQAGAIAGSVMSAFIIYAWWTGFGPAMLIGTLWRALLGATVSVLLGIYLGALRDTNSRLVRALDRSRRKLADLNAELSSHVQDRTRDLDVARERLQINQDRLRRVTRRWLDAQESERRGVARDLHDDIGQSLTALRLNLEVGRLKNEQHPDAVGILDNCKSLVDAIIASVRRLSLNLRPAMLDDMGLFAAIRDHAARQLELSGIDLTVRTSGDDSAIDPDVAITLFRIVQEAVNNIVKHAGASHVVIRLDAKAATLQITIRDDGVGFDVDERVRQAEHFGLVSMRERLSLINGELLIRSSPGAGTELRATIPEYAHQEVA